uniref:Uncharacterized protein n=1 Tax=Panagrolaimus davidi TaxID=227884 RepID=A0A914PP77_9BILA
MIILTTLGGFEELKADKQRKELNLLIMEDIIEVGGQMKAIQGSCDGNYFNCKYPGVKIRLLHPPRSISRQLACSSGDGLKKEYELPKAPPLNRQRGGESSDNDDGADGLPDMEANDDEVHEDKKELTKNVDPNAKAEEFSPPPHNSQGGDSTLVIARMRPRFAGNISYQEFHGRGDLTPKAGSPRKSTLPWRPKVSDSQVEAFIQQAREKFLGYTIPGDLTSTFALPPSIDLSLEAFHRHIYKSLSGIHIANDDKYNRFPFTQKEKITNTPTERLYVALLPQIGDYLVALLKMVLAALPSSKS